jgi:hypothetical protein
MMSPEGIPPEGIPPEKILPGEGAGGGGLKAPARLSTVRPHCSLSSTPRPKWKWIRLEDLFLDQDQLQRVVLESSL